MTTLFHVKKGDRFILPECMDVPSRECTLAAINFEGEVHVIFDDEKGTYGTYEPHVFCALAIMKEQLSAWERAYEVKVDEEGGQK